MDVTGPYILESCGSYRFHIKIESLIHEIKIFDKNIIKYDIKNSLLTIVLTP